ncbi:glycoside hydrolase [Mollisia scopiformis]|uniref:Glycoside hydrolase n=1 Tax=Mollisia scopiformis TaxID=149040 RepID=A0A194XBN1_MOLSC|nr:glycoside hydrolase [Mollisia scopiformis]KUJ17571.1 glycoside hydrolase [Mollisia scopiformis]
MLSTSLFFLVLFALVRAQDDNDSTDPAALPVVTVNVSTSQTYQTISGFGISQAFNRAASIYHLPNATQSKILDLLFDDSVGAGLTILRNGVGSSNSTALDYMLSIEPNPPSTSISNGTATYAWNGNDSSQVWLSQQAQKYGVQTFYASAWSAPWYMKSNENDQDGGYLCGVTGTKCGTGDWRQHFANYLVQYLREYQDAGINVTHLGFLNEPDISPSYAGMRSNGSQAVDFLKILAPTLQSSNFSHVKLVCCDNTGWSIAGATLSELQSASGEKYLSVYSAHGYSAAPTDPLKTSLPVWQTEWSDLTTPFTALWDSAVNTTDDDTGDVTTTDGTEVDGFVWATNIQDSLVKANVSAFLHWMGAEESSGSDMLIRINSTTNSYTVSKRLWAFAHFGRYVKPDSRRIYANSSAAWEDFSVSAFESANVGRSGIKSIAVQVINKGWANVTVSMRVEGAREGGVVLPVTTNEGVDVGSGEYLAVWEGLVNATVPARSLMSFVFS